ncbi:MAG: hypothetical protein ACI4O7_15880 [Aristaeellaceae bacterium]
MSIRAKWIALLTAVVVMLVGMQLYYGSIGTESTANASPETTFSWWIYSGTSSEYFDSYAENPAIQYTLQKTWGPEEKGIAFSFLQPAPGSENDNYTTMLASGDLPDLIDMAISEPARVMMEKGYAIELTEYVQQYMPNYVALVHSSNEIFINAVTVDDEGNEHYYGLTTIRDAPEPVFQGFMYRRDWIVKYGVNPATGEAFTGGFTDEEDVDSWVDDVIFPSWVDDELREKALAIDPDWDGTDPFYVSDWEWMFQIFVKAQTDLGITDKYCISVYYPGFTWSGGLLSCFGGGVNVWYQDLEGQVHFGGSEDSFKTYLECLHHWYEEGWLDHDFSQRTADAFYQIDDSSVRQGKVPMFNGQQSQIGGRMDMHDGGFTEGIFVSGARYPINDIYGPDSCRFVQPNCVMGGGLTNMWLLITPTAQDKDLATLCSYLDYFYTAEGALVKSIGLSAEQAASLESSTFYADNGLADGAYTMNADGVAVKNPVLVNDSGQLKTAVCFERAPGILLNSTASVDLGYAATFQHTLNEWMVYPNTGFFQGSRVTNEMSEADSNTADNARAKVLEYMTKNCANFITGKSNFTTDWDKWCKTLQKYKVDQITELYQTYIDKYPWR